MFDPPRFVFPGFEVRLAEPGDVAGIVAYFRDNSEHLRASRPTPPEGFLTEAWWRETVARSVAEFGRGEAARCFLFEGARVSGSVSLTAIQRGPLQAAYLGYGLAADRQGRGWMSLAVHALVRYGFETLNLHRIMANHVPENARSARLLARLGFEREGRARAYLRLDGAWRDHVLTARVNPDWRAPPSG